MKVTRDEVARILAELPDQIGRRKKWEDLAHYKRLTYKVEADRFLQVLKILKEKFIKEKTIDRNSRIKRTKKNMDTN